MQSSGSYGFIVPFMWSPRRRSSPGKVSQVFLQAVATRELWKAAGSRRRQQKAVGGSRKSWEATESRGRQQEVVEDTKVKPSSGHHAHL